MNKENSMNKKSNQASATTKKNWTAPSNSKTDSTSPQKSFGSNRETYKGASQSTDRSVEPKEFEKPVQNIKPSKENS